MYNYLPFFLLLFCSCALEKKQKLLFHDIGTQSGISFSNDLVYTDEFNPYTYRNFYNGAGVAIGDINNDGFLDIYFTGNQVDNKLYLNQGNFKFVDITNSAGVGCSSVWSTGATFVDINSDGYLDIYVCKSGSTGMSNRHNELFVNNGNLTFTERSKEYGLDVVGLSVQAAFFDFDKDGDLDCYLLTNSFESIGSFDFVVDQRKTIDPNGGNIFFINDKGKFRDITKQAGIYSSSIGFGLGITLGDFNQDSWVDIFVSNDFFERDYLYINKQDGTFEESLTDYFESVSMGSMGADMADLDGDGLNELFVTEMLPDSLSRRKHKTVFESWDRYQYAEKQGYHHQFGRNVLQKRIGNNSYAEVGRLAGVASSEWSWGALLFDMDNDGLRDIFVANGIRKDLLDRDYLTYTASDENIRQLINTDSHAITKLIDKMAISRFSNYAYRNRGNLSFENANIEWGLDKVSYSSGSSYGDLDNDGDLDLVVSNIDGAAFIYQNNTDTSTHKSITLSFKSSTGNTYAIGASIRAYSGNNLWVADNYPVKGYQSCVQPRITLGLGNRNYIDSMHVIWPDGRTSIFRNLSLNKNIEINDSNAISSDLKFLRDHLPFELQKVDKQLFKHHGNNFVDFDRDRLLPMMYSNEAPFISKTDLDQDGTQDLYIGGGKEQLGEIVSYHKGFNKFDINLGEEEVLSEETNGVFFDADNDGDLDFYLASGGRFFPAISDAQRDKLYFNIEKGKFMESIHRLPIPNFSTSVVKVLDANKDGNPDLIVASRFDPFVYGKPVRSYLLINDGLGQFSVNANWDIEGMITDIDIVDFNQDGWDDLVVVGDWMPITFYQNNKDGTFTDESAPYKVPRLTGWWHTVESSDLNRDGKPDFVIGNHGLNSFFKSKDRMYISDFDANGSFEQVYCTLVGNKYYPIHDRDELLSQLPSLKKSLLYYKDYSYKSIDQIFTSTQLEHAQVLSVDTLVSAMLLSSENGYEFISLPLEAQYAPIYALLIEDLDNDGVLDLIAGGNQFGVKPQFGRFDASKGWFFKGCLSNSKYYSQKGISLNVSGQIRDIEVLNVNLKKYIFFAKYDDRLEIFEVLE